MLYHDKPKNQGVENGLKRAKQIVDFEWTPLKMIPSNHCIWDAEKVKHYLDTHIRAGEPQKGVIYSSARIVDKHVGFEVPLETYATALQNPDSVLYERTLHGTSGHGVGCYYGIVCSAFASYVHDLPYQVTCKYWPSYPGVTHLEMEENWPESADGLELLDIVLNPKQHIAVITDILRDVDGHVAAIEVSESVLPVARRTVFGLEEFRTFWFGNGFTLFRREGLEKITYTPNPYSPVEGDEELIDESNIYEMKTADYAPSFMTDYGDKANYALGEPVIVTVFDETIDAVDFYDSDDNCTTVPVEEGKAVYRPEKAGLYYATAVNRFGEPESLTWYTFDCKVETDKKVYKKGEPIHVKYHDAENQDRMVNYYLKTHDRYLKYTEVFTDEMRKNGKFVIPGVEDAGDYYVVVYSRSPFAQYGSIEVRIDVE